MKWASGGAQSVPLGIPVPQPPAHKFNSCCGVWDGVLVGGWNTVGYGVSLVLFVLALRHLGAARTGACFSTAPFIGAVLARMLFGEPATIRLITAAVLMGTGLWLHLAEHQHAHEEMARAPYRCGRNARVTLTTSFSSALGSAANPSSRHSCSMRWFSCKTSPKISPRPRRRAWSMMSVIRA